MRKWLFFRVLLVLALFCVTVGGYWLYTIGFWSTPLPKRDFALYDLLLTEEDLGTGWRLTEDNGWQMENSTILEQWNREFVYVNQQGQSLFKIEHFVYRCDNESHASFYVKQFRDYAKINKEVAPDELLFFFQPRYADEWFLGKYSYYARYKEFVIVFAIEIIEKNNADLLYRKISYTQLADWLHTLDERVGYLLKESKRK